MPLKLTIPAGELYDESKNEFIATKEQTITLEHSLVSLSKWESKWCKSFLSDDNKTAEEAFDYIRCMTLTQNVDPNVYKFLTPEQVNLINAYILKDQTATTFTDLETHSKKPKERITSELIYYWMVSCNIPVEFQKWHLSRLIALIRICQIKNAPQKKMGKSDIRKFNTDLNAKRRAMLHSKG